MMVSVLVADVQRSTAIAPPLPPPFKITMDGEQNIGVRNLC